MVNRPDRYLDWMGLAEAIPAQSFLPRKRRAPYIPAIPRSFLRTAAPAGDSLELLLVALAEMRKRGVNEIAIGPSLWHLVGNPSKRVRTRLLRQIGRLPPTLCSLVRRKGRPHLLVTGPEWPRARR